jgi:hypothetical protein
MTSNAGTQGAVPARESARRQVPRLITGAEIRERIHGSSAMGAFNNRLALIITKAVGTMWAAYLFVVISFVSFPQALQAFRGGDTVTGITWLSQSFLQLVLLPIIIVGQNIISSSQDARAEADHEPLTALHDINVQQLELLEQQKNILDLLQPKES